MKKTIFAVSLTVIMSAVICHLLLMTSVNVFNTNQVDVIIDAGHGDPDGGAIATDNTHEADLNLQIALKIYNELKQRNINCILTRTDSNGIYTKGDSIHSKKVSDIRNRIEIANKNNQALFLSIHMNTYSSSEVCGAQVFYKNTGVASKEIAYEIQNAINVKFQPNNVKKTKIIPSNVYLFNHIENECVLIECGFLTNEDDLKKIKSEAYQTDFSKSIAETIIFTLYGG